MHHLRRVLLGLFSITTISMFVSSAQAADKADCISVADMNDIVASFSQFQHLKGKEFCYDGSTDSALLEAIMFMRNTQFASTMPASHDELFSGKFATSWWKYFTGRINKFNVQQNCPEGAAAYVIGFFGGHTMYVCPLMLTGSLTALDRASIYMHEARHIDGFPHVTCSHGPRKGINGACDDNIKDSGSYAVTVETYAQLGKYATDLNPAMMAYAQASAVVYANDAFEVPVNIDQTQNFVVMTADKQFHEVNIQGGGKQISDLGFASDLGRIIMRGVYYVLFPDDKNLPAKYVFTHNEGDLAQTPGSDAGEYNASSPQEKANFVAIHYAGNWGVRAYKNKLSVSCDPQAGVKSDLNISGTPVSFIYPNGYDREARMVFLMMANGTVMEVGCKSKTQPYQQATNMSFDRPFTRMYKSGNAVVGLGADGKIYQVNGQTSTPITTPFDGQIYELLAHKNFTFF
ncbi:MAG: hypothetical protein H6623_08530 [Bdellovibrionaceae bacterium]|nr:hypothetical protein [Pseudobdellovibrionaceae bacterium]